MLKCLFANKAPDYTISICNMNFSVAGIAVGVLLLIAAVWSKKPFIASLRGKHVFLTGASSGIGLAVARQLLREGAYVTLVSRNNAKLEKAAKSLLKEVGCPKERVLTKAADVGDYKAISKAVMDSFDWRPIDILMCNAGLTRSGFIEEFSVEEINTVVQTNLLGSVYPLHAALPNLKLRSRDHPISIVFVGSLASLCWLYGNGVYTGTKYAVKGLAECLRLEVAPYNIRVNLVCPGFVESPFLDDVNNDEELTAGMLAASFYNRDWAQTPEAVARIAIAGIKAGKFVITTTPVLGPILVILTRGFAPSESFLRNFMEAVLSLPLRMISSLSQLAIVGRLVQIHRKHNPAGR